MIYDIFLVKIVGDPYEGDETIAVCTSIDNALALDFDELWMHVESNRKPLWDGCSTEDNFDTWKNLKNGKILKDIQGLDRPNIYIEKVPLNVRFNS